MWLKFEKNLELTFNSLPTKNSQKKHCATFSIIRLLSFLLDHKIMAADHKNVPKWKFKHLWKNYYYSYQKNFNTMCTGGVTSARQKLILKFNQFL